MNRSILLSLLAVAACGAVSSCVPVPQSPPPNGGMPQMGPPAPSLAWRTQSHWDSRQWAATQVFLIVDGRDEWIYETATKDEPIRAIRGGAGVPHNALSAAELYTSAGPITFYVEEVSPGFLEVYGIGGGAGDRLIKSIRY